MLVTASWGGADVAVEVDAECRSVAALKRCLQEALPEVDVEAVLLEVCGRSVDDEGVISLVEGSVIDISVTQAALAAATLREEGRDVDFDGFCHAAAAGDVRVCRLYLEASVVWPSGVTNPLHIAVSRDHGELCKLLLGSGCAKEEKDKNGRTPLRLAIRKDDMQMVKLLLDSNCEKDEKDENGNTPLRYAIRSANMQLAKLLLDAGCAKDKKDYSGDTPLHVALRKDDMEMAKLLLDAGCAKNEKNRRGDPPLHHAIIMSKIHVAKLLLDAGCAKAEKDNIGDTPLHVALRRDDMEMVRLLLDAGCPKAEKNNRGKTPLDSCTEGTVLHKFLLSRGCA